MSALPVAIVLSMLFLDATPARSQQSTKAEVLTNETLIKLVKAGIRDDVIVGMINSQPGEYSVSPKAVIAMKEAGVSDNVIAAAVNRNNSAVRRSPEAPASNRQSELPDNPTVGKPRKLTVLTVSHSRSERDFTVTTPRTTNTNTNCDLYPNSVNCRSASTSYGGVSEEKAVYRFVEIVTANEGGKVIQYTLSRTARWVWSSMDSLNDRESFPAEIKGKRMFITCRRGGNQGKKETLKYDILDIRPVR